MHAFEFLSARDPSAAIAAAAKSGTAQQGASVRFVAGATTLLDLMKLGVETPGLLVDVTRLLPAGIEESAAGLRIGAGARNSDVAADPRVRERYPVLSRALLAGASGLVELLPQLHQHAIDVTGGGCSRPTSSATSPTRWSASAASARAPGSSC